jgi:hypothetical protein
MLVSLVGRLKSDKIEQQVDRYAAWAAAVQRLRADWLAGNRPEAAQLRAYLEEIPAEQHAEALQDLLAAHLLLRWEGGQGLRLEDYFRELGLELAAVPADLVQDEFLARYAVPHGDMPSPAEYERRFPGRADVQELLRARCLDGGGYVRLRRRGRGAMGEVWEAHDRHLQRRVAIKLPQAGRLADPEFLSRFAEEARVTAGLEHPGIVGVHAFHTPAEGPPFYVMRLVDGEPLSAPIWDYHHPPPERTPGEQRLRWGRLMQCFAAACEALAFAHARGVIHRDLKPGNIAVGAYGETVILDWGLAQRLDASHPPVAGIVVGTPDYMPPEQVDGIADRRSDVFGLGAVLYELLTGRAPHTWADGCRPADWQQVVRRAEFARPRSLAPRTPRALEQICLKALARDPTERYPDAAELVRDIRCHLAGASSTGGLMGWLRRLLRG